MMNTLSQLAPLVLLLLLASVLFALPGVTAGQGHMKNEVAFYIATWFVPRNFLKKVKLRLLS
jgi:hypothetical protein